jgi:hypothetical protein
VAGLETAMRDDGDIGLVEMKIVLLVSDLGLRLGIGLDMP